MVSGLLLAPAHVEGGWRGHYPETKEPHKQKKLFHSTTFNIVRFNMFGHPIE